MSTRATPPTAPPSPEPGTPTTAILDAARRLFADNGFSGTSTRRIAEAAKVNLAMIHYYFGSKELLYRRVIELELTELLRLVLAGFKADSSPQDILAGLPRFVMEMHRQRPELMKLMLREMTDGAPRLPEVIRELGQHGPLGLRQTILSVIEAAQVKGFADGIPPAHLMAVIFGIGNGLMAFAPMVAVILDLDMNDPETAAAVGRSAEIVVRRAVAPAKEA